MTTQDQNASISPLDRLYNAARDKLAALYTDKAPDILAGRYSKTAEIFLMDALGEKNLPTFPHHLDDDRLQEIIDQHLPTLFEGLSDSLIAFYRRKLDETKPRR